ncbi:hypothetical protein EDEG_01128 [Edhazardia aedis USNM 41457]|uniref:Uncharacterized protein n=1 Tax=Edhazardia aedis (strain USNM 41457) TaxID=1003232 RepID=J9DQ54_EDHAE|nr:hypothetical protein EDEG_01128 [Edhazardia aedis USNM 41457]|eukprot:EJW04680.1 hypothetical protein EDEG_01128 [Edhazardia aedis USNM 41457]
MKLDRKRVSFSSKVQVKAINESSSSASNLSANGSTLNESMELTSDLTQTIKQALLENEKCVTDFGIISEGQNRVGEENCSNNEEFKNVLEKLRMEVCDDKFSLSVGDNKDGEQNDSYVQNLGISNKNAKLMENVVDTRNMNKDCINFENSNLETKSNSIETFFNENEGSLNKKVYESSDLSQNVNNEIDKFYNTEKDIMNAMINSSIFVNQKNGTDNTYAINCAPKENISFNSANDSNSNIEKELKITRTNDCTSNEHLKIDQTNEFVQKSEKCAEKVETMENTIKYNNKQSDSKEDNKNKEKVDNQTENLFNTSDILSNTTELLENSDIFNVYSPNKNLINSYPENKLEILPKENIPKSEENKTAELERSEIYAENNGNLFLIRNIILDKGDETNIDEFLLKKNNNKTERPNHVELSGKSMSSINTSEILPSFLKEPTKNNKNVRKNSKINLNEVKNVEAHTTSKDDQKLLNITKKIISPVKPTRNKNKIQRKSLLKNEKNIKPNNSISSPTNSSTVSNKKNFNENNKPEKRKSKNSIQMKKRKSNNEQEDAQEKVEEDSPAMQYVKRSLINSNTHHTNRISLNDEIFDSCKTENIKKILPMKTIESILNENNLVYLDPPVILKTELSMKKQNILLDNELLFFNKYFTKPYFDYLQNSINDLNNLLAIKKTEIDRIKECVVCYDKSSKSKHNFNETAGKGEKLDVFQIIPSLKTSTRSKSKNECNQMKLSKFEQFIDILKQNKNILNKILDTQPENNEEIIAKQTKLLETKKALLLEIETQKQIRRNVFSKKILENCQLLNVFVGKHDFFNSHADFKCLFAINSIEKIQKIIRSNDFSKKGDDTINLTNKLTLENMCNLLSLFLSLLLETIDQNAKKISELTNQKNIIIDKISRYKHIYAILKHKAKQITKEELDEERMKYNIILYITNIALLSIKEQCTFKIFDIMINFNQEILTISIPNKYSNFESLKGLSLDRIEQKNELKDHNYDSCSNSLINSTVISTDVANASHIKNNGDVSIYKCALNNISVSKIVSHIYKFVYENKLQ